MGGIQNKSTAEFCGAMIGDGWIQSNEKSLFLAGDPKEDKDYYDFHILSLVSDVVTPVKSKNFPYWGVYGISIHKKKIIRKILSELSLTKGKKVDNAKIPSWILKSKEDVKESFIRGLFDTDGGIFCQKDYTKYSKSEYHTKIRLRFTTISKELNENLFKLLSNLGYKVRKRTLTKGFQNNRNNHDVQILEINSISSIAKFFSEIKPSNPKHLTKYLIWEKFGFCPPKTTIIQRKDILKNTINPYHLYKQE